MVEAVITFNQQSQMLTQPFVLSTVRGIGIEVIGVQVEIPGIKEHGIHQKNLYMVRSDIFFKHNKPPKNIERYLTNSFVLVLLSNREFKIATHVCDIVNSNKTYLSYFNKYIVAHERVYDFLNNNTQVLKSATYFYSKTILVGNKLMMDYRYNYLGFDPDTLPILKTIKEIECGDYEIEERGGRIFICNKATPKQWLQVDGHIIDISYDSMEEAIKAKNLLLRVGITDAAIS